MAFFKFFGNKQKTKPARPRRRTVAAPASDQTLHDLRLRARHRLIGAVVLVLVAIVVFPLLFDTQPRPDAVRAPLVILDADGEPGKREAPVTIAMVPTRASLAEGEEIIRPAGTEPAGEAVPAAEPPQADGESGRSAEAAAQVDPDSDVAEDQPASEADDFSGPITVAKIRVAPAPEVQASRSASPAAPARAEPPASEPVRSAPAAPPAPAPRAAPPGGRYAVQVGAFAKEEQVRSVRNQLRGAGLESFTQVIQTAGGKRTRVRVGPYADRADAERILRRIQSTGLPGQVVSL